MNLKNTGGLGVVAGAAATVEVGAGLAVHTIVGEGRSTDTDTRGSTAVEATVATEIKRKNTTNIVIRERVTHTAVSIQMKKMIDATVESTKKVIDKSITPVT